MAVKRTPTVPLVTAWMMQSESYSLVQALETTMEERSRKCVEEPHRMETPTEVIYLPLTALKIAL